MYIQVAEQYRAALFGGDVMLTNADCTLYEKDSFSRHVFTDVYWNDSRGQTVSKNGIQVNDSVLMYIYDGDYLPKAGDIIIKGNISDEYSCATQQGQSASMKALRTAHPDFAVVKAANDCRYGGLPHIEVIAR